MPKQRATKQRDVSEEYGRPAWVYSDGSVRGERGHMIVKLDNQGKDITRQNAHLYAEAKQNKVQEAIRAALVAGTPGGKIPGADATAILAAGAAKLYHEAMAGTDAAGQPIYMRDRLKAWDLVGLRAGLLEERRQEQAPSSAIAGLLGLALGLAAQRGQVVDGEVTEAEAENE